MPVRQPGYQRLGLRGPDLKSPTPMKSGDLDLLAKLTLERVRCRLLGVSILLIFEATSKKSGASMYSNWVLLNAFFFWGFWLGKTSSPLLVYWIGLLADSIVPSRRNPFCFCFTFFFFSLAKDFSDKSKVNSFSSFFSFEFTKSRKSSGISRLSLGRWTSSSALWSIRFTKCESPEQASYPKMCPTTPT